MRCLIVAACTLAVVIVGSSDGAPRVVCNDRSHDFGFLGETEKVEHSFLIKNDGDSVLSIGDARSTCGGCSSVKVGETIVLPGSNTSVVTSLDLRGRFGPVEHAVWIRTNDETAPLMKLVVRGRIVPEFVVTPEKLFLGHIEASDRQPRGVLIGSSMSSPVEVARVECNSTGLDVCMIKKESNKWFVSVQANDKLPVGKLNAMLTVHFEKDARPHIEVPIFGMVGPK